MVHRTTLYVSISTLSLCDAVESRVNTQYAHMLSDRHLVDSIGSSCRVCATPMGVHTKILSNHDVVVGPLTKLCEAEKLRCMYSSKGKGVCGIPHFDLPYQPRSTDK